jgi:hypothetical protein
MNPVIDRKSLRHRHVTKLALRDGAFEIPIERVIFAFNGQSFSRRNQWTALW